VPARHAAPRPSRYRGRHRAPSTSARALTIGGIGVGTLAVSVIAPAAAHAATSSQWDRVAQCESGGNWAADTGNGYYGGLQFSASTWDGYGGQAYAPTANEASAGEQMAVADKVLAAQGWGAWPVCSREAGVAGEPTTESATPSVATPTPAASSSSSSSSTSGSSPVIKPFSGPPRKDANYTVKPGDTLNAIAARYSHTGGWHRIWSNNKRVIGSNPSLIEPGMKLMVHGAGKPLTDRHEHARH
jgi:resuscitation-promoting factor RpfA